MSKKQTKQSRRTKARKQRQAERRNRLIPDKVMRGMAMAHTEMEMSGLFSGGGKSFLAGASMRQALALAAASMMKRNVIDDKDRQ